MNQGKQLNDIKEMMKEVRLSIIDSKESNGYECFNARVVAKLEALRDQINASFEDLRKEIGLIHR